MKNNFLANKSNQFFILHIENNFRVWIFVFRWICNGWTLRVIFNPVILGKFSWIFFSSSNESIRWITMNKISRRFVITSSIFVFSVLFALQLDEHIKISYWLVFLPLFIWKMLVVFGAFIGIFFWCKNGENERW